MPESSDIQHSNTTADVGNTQQSLWRRILSEAFSWIRVLLIAFVLAWICANFLILNTRVTSGSMEDTIPSSSRVLSSRVHYWFSDPSRSDVVIFDAPDGDEYYYIKRIIGLPGETVTIKDGLVYINDSEDPLDEPYVKGVPNGDFGPYEVPENSYFVLGDNRDNSSDSRYWINTYVSRDKIYARALLVYWPKISVIR